jgi:excisionase family DNA binding protein
MEEFLTVAQVAVRLKLTQQPVGNWIDAGTLPAYRVGRRVRVSHAGFERLMKRAIPAAAQATTTGGPASGI